MTAEPSRHGATEVPQRVEASGPAGTSGRPAELAANLTIVRTRIAAAEAAAGRTSGDVTLIAVSKYFPASDVEALAELGVRDFGENKHQEAVDKVAQVHAEGLCWHFIGQLQTNKAAAVAKYADQVDSVDRRSLVTALDKGARAAARTIGVLIQVSLDGADTTGRGGVDPSAVEDLAQDIEVADTLQLRGVMGVAPHGGDAAAAFVRLVEISRDLQRRHPGATQVSAGMSGDIEAAVAAGATHVRVGTALLGRRPSLG